MTETAKKRLTARYVQFYRESEEYMEEDMMTLRELCRVSGVTRRAVQGYEQKGLITPCGKNSRGYLLYDNEAQKQVRYIRSLQSYGFRLDEIAELRTLSPEALRLRLIEQLLQLEVRKSALEKTIRQLTKQIEELM